ncbi:reverse transcriptase domain-containing protein [Tanacetum coccineum]|uniref:Reverse transcriptase domain-containing protein n=1 Tax=Tanacetum coccineum TaxID=301880 RepID=A0ABQ4X9Z3_9ASTR
MKIPNVPNTSVKLMLFPFSLEGAARIWLEKEPPRSIETWDDLVSKFINKFFPPSKTTNLRNEITRFQQKFDETFYEAWDRFNDLLRGCPHHGFSELHQLDTFYNALNSIDQDSLNSAAGVVTANTASTSGLALFLVTLVTTKGRFKCITTEVGLPSIGRKQLIMTPRVEKDTMPPANKEARRRPNSCCSNSVSIFKRDSRVGIHSIFEPIVSTASPNLTPFGDSDFLLFEEADSFLALEDDPTSSEVDPTYQDPEGDIVDDKLPVIFAKDLKGMRKRQLFSRFSSPTGSHRLETPSDIKGVNHQILLLTNSNGKEDPTNHIPGTLVYQERRHNVITTMENELIHTRMVTGYGESHIDPNESRKTTFTCTYGIFRYRRQCLLGYAMLPGFPDCEDSRARSIHMSFTSQLHFGNPVSKSID